MLSACLTLLSLKSYGRSQIKQINFHLEPHHNQIYYVNIDGLYAISVKFLSLRCTDKGIAMLR